MLAEKLHRLIDGERVNVFRYSQVWASSRLTLNSQMTWTFVRPAGVMKSEREMPIVSR
jgi:hypothetical protein